MTTVVCTKELPALGTMPDWCDVVLAWADRFRWWLFGCLGVAYALGFNGQWRMEPDSALYLSIARNIATGHGYTYHGQPNAVAYPGLPYLLSIPMRLFPQWHLQPRELWSENLLMVLIAVATLALTYRTIRLNAGRPAAVVVTCATALTRTFYRSAFALMTDMPFLLGVMAFLAGYEGMVRRNGTGKRFHWRDALLMTGGIALTIAMRPAWLAFVPVAVLVLCAAGFSGKMNWKAATVGVVAALLAGILFYCADPRRAAVDSNARYESQLFDQFTPTERSQIPARALDNLIDIFRETATSAMVGIKYGPAPDAPGARHWYDLLGATVNVISAAATLALGLLLIHRRAMWGLWIATTIAMMVFVLPHERYFLQILPLLIFGWWRGLTWLNHRLPAVAGNLIFFCLAGLGFIPNFCHVVGLVVEQRTVPFLAHYHGGTYVPLTDAAKRLDWPDVPAGALVLAPDKTARIMSYLSNRNVIESNEQCDDLRNWPPPHGQRIFALYDPTDAKFAAWLSSLGVDLSGPLTNSRVRFDLRWITRASILAHYQQINRRAAAQ